MRSCWLWLQVCIPVLLWMWSSMDKRSWWLPVRGCCSKKSGYISMDMSSTLLCWWILILTGNVCTGVGMFILQDIIMVCICLLRCTKVPSHSYEEDFSNSCQGNMKCLLLFVCMSKVFKFCFCLFLFLVFWSWRPYSVSVYFRDIKWTNYWSFITSKIKNKK